jgi:carboxylate-amine ligase
VRTAAEYQATVRTATDTGAALDARSVYYLARLSPRYPTVEVRLADVSLTVAEAVTYAGLVRAVAGQALTGAPVGADVAQDVLSTACRVAARSGLTGQLIDPTTGRRLAAWDYVDRLVGDVLPVLARYGDAEWVLRVLRRLRTVGGSAERHRRIFAAASGRAPFVSALAAALLGSPHECGVDPSAA